jgi:hypothetical protein
MGKVVECYEVRLPAVAGDMRYEVRGTLARCGGKYKVCLPAVVGITLLTVTGRGLLVAASHFAPITSAVPQTDLTFVRSPARFPGKLPTSFLCARVR